MKCEHCGKNEVTFVYRSNINGKTEEHHLCQDCAEKLGYTQKLFARPSMLERFWGNDDFFDDFFSPMPSLLNRMGRMLEDPFDDFFDTMPALSAAPTGEAAKEEKHDELLSREEQSRFSYLRQLNALKLEQKKAIHAENFERAAELRDEIRKLEQAHREAKNGRESA